MGLHRGTLSRESGVGSSLCLAPRHGRSEAMRTLDTNVPNRLTAEIQNIEHHQEDTQNADVLAITKRAAKHNLKKRTRTAGQNEQGTHEGVVALRWLHSGHCRCISGESNVLQGYQ
jgi:hypothetical protein